MSRRDGEIHNENAALAVPDWDSEDAYKQVMTERGTAQPYGRFGVSERGSDLRKTIDTTIHGQNNPSVSELLKLRASFITKFIGYIGSLGSGISSLIKGSLGSKS